MKRGKEEGQVQECVWGWDVKGKGKPVSKDTAALEQELPIVYDHVTHCIWCHFLKMS
jgi:hypothetical protein